jgi:hypothetical protein
MLVQQFVTFRNSFGLIKGRCQDVAQEFQTWQNEFLFQYGFHLSETALSGPISDALKNFISENYTDFDSLSILAVE